MKQMFNANKVVPYLLCCVAGAFPRSHDSQLTCCDQLGIHFRPNSCFAHAIKFALASDPGHESLVICHAMELGVLWLTMAAGTRGDLILIFGHADDIDIVGTWGSLRSTTSPQTLVRYSLHPFGLPQPFPRNLGIRPRLARLWPSSFTWSG